MIRLRMVNHDRCADTRHLFNVTRNSFAVLKICLNLWKLNIVDPKIFNIVRDESIIDDISSNRYTEILVWNGEITN